jgi:hypothetical protein
MYRTKLLILLLLCASSLSCSYSFVLDGKRSTEKYTLAPSKNGTSLIDAGAILDANLERTLTSMGMIAPKGSIHTLESTLSAYTVQTVTSPSLSSRDRYRLLIYVTARITDEKGKDLWHMNFSDTGTFSQGGRAEDALPEACERVSQQIARALASVTL